MASSSSSTTKKTTTTNTTATDQYNGFGTFSTTANRPADYTDPYANQTQDQLSKVLNYGDFSYGSAPSYTNEYQALQQQYLNNLLNRDQFSYNPNTDPVYSSYEKTYRREGNRATANALAQASAATGGRPSSYAVSAATQAGNYYASQLSDIIPTLYQQAYDRYLNEYQMKQSDLNAINTQEQMDYNRYLTNLQQYNTDRDLAYNTWLQGYNMAQNGLNALNQQSQIDYGRYADALNQYNIDRNFDYNQYTYEQSIAQETVNQILANGGTPSDELLARAGYTPDYASTLAAEWARQQGLNMADWYAGYGDYSRLAELGIDTSYLAAMQRAELAQADAIINGYSLSGGGSGGSGGRGGRTSGNTGDGTDSNNIPDTDPLTQEYIDRFNGGDFSEEVIKYLAAHGFNEQDLRDIADYMRSVYKTNNANHKNNLASMTADERAAEAAAAAGISPNTSGVVGTNYRPGSPSANLIAAGAGISPLTTGMTGTNNRPAAGTSSSTNTTVPKPGDIGAVTPADLINQQYFVDSANEQQNTIRLPKNTNGINGRYYK